jgi:glucose-6-phosphate 1-dehydrogenase
MRLERPPPQALVVFGASGDLTRRKILPALYNLFYDGFLPEPFMVVGYARTGWDEEAFRDQARKAVEEFSRRGVDEERWEGFARLLHYMSGSFDENDAFKPLHERLLEFDQRYGTEGRRLYYCATPPSAFPVIVRRLGECGPQDKAAIVVEKPFGHDLESAKDLSAVIHEEFDESRVFRIDHYLGKETVQNILVFRFANSLFERAWNREAVDHIQITVAESIGVEGRGAYYEEAGAIRDILQNHLLQVLSFLAMEPPRSLEPEAIRDETVKLLCAMLPLDPADVVRGQYTAGTVEGAQVSGYRDEADVAPDSDVETFVAVRAWIENWRWSDVPIFLRTGKRLARRATEIAVVFRRPPAYLFEGIGLPSPPSDHLVIRIAPQEGISFDFQSKETGAGFEPRTVRMDFSYGDPSSTPDAYERLLHDAMIGDQTLFTRKDGVERAWELVEPVLDRHGTVATYPAGSWGPREAEELIAPREWHVGGSEDEEPRTIRAQPDRTGKLWAGRP